MSNACLCVGVCVHTTRTFWDLPGAVVDADRVFSVLTDTEIGECDLAVSKKLLNPTKDNVTRALEELVYNSEVETLNLYFACHGDVEDDSYYLVCSDTDGDKLPFTALGFSELLRLLRPRGFKHTNIIIDACYAGGISNDLTSIFQPQALGNALSISISILTLSARDQRASGGEEGGFGTTALIELMKGKQDTGSNNSHLSLLDLGQAIRIARGNQIARVWSFAVSGTLKFCRNVFAEVHRTDQVFAVPDIAPVAVSALEKRTLDRLFLTFNATTKELDCRDLQSAIESGLSQISDASAQAGFLRGMFAGCLEQASENPDCFARVLVAGVFLLCSQRMTACEQRESTQNVFWDALSKEMEVAFDTIERELRDKDVFLLHADGSFVEFFTLPMRISRLAAWSLFYVHLSEFDSSKLSVRREQCASILALIEESYSLAYDLVSEEQAAYLLLISALCKRFGLSSWAENYIGSLYCNFFFFERKVASTELPDSKVFDFIEYRLFAPEVNYKEFSSKPSELVFSLLLHYLNYSQMDVIRYDFLELDGVYVNTFVPESYERFSDLSVAGGKNLGFAIGFDVFTAADFESFVRDHVAKPVREAASKCVQREPHLSVLSSLVYPDRLALHLVDILVDA